MIRQQPASGPVTTWNYPLPPPGAGPVGAPGYFGGAPPRENLSVFQQPPSIPPPQIPPPDLLTKFDFLGSTTDEWGF